MGKRLLLLEELELTRHPCRFGSSNLHQRDPRSALFEGYTGGGSGSDNRRAVSASPSRGYGYGLPPPVTSSGHLGVDAKGFRPATPNSRGQYSGAVLDELESQNDAQVEGIMGKVRILKDVSTQNVSEETTGCV